MIDIPKPIPWTKYFKQKYGGKWKYDCHGTWICNDGKRFINRVAGCSCDGDCDHPSRMYLYGDGIPKLVM